MIIYLPTFRGKLIDLVNNDNGLDFFIIIIKFFDLSTETWGCFGKQKAISFGCLIMVVHLRTLIQNITH